MSYQSHCPPAFCQSSGAGYPERLSHVGEYGLDRPIAARRRGSHGGAERGSTGVWAREEITRQRAGHLNSRTHAGTHKHTYAHVHTHTNTHTDTYTTKIIHTNTHAKQYTPVYRPNYSIVPITYTDRLTTRHTHIQANFHRQPPTTLHIQLPGVTLCVCRVEHFTSFFSASMYRPLFTGNLPTTLHIQSYLELPCPYVG